MTTKLASFIDSVEQEQDGVKFMESICKGPRCGMVVGGTSNRGRKFHVIICPDVDYDTRKWFYETSSDRDRPPLLRYPSPGLTPAGAKKLVNNCTSKMMNVAITDILNPNAWAINPIFAKFAADKLDVNEARPWNEASAVEQKISDLLLMRCVVEETLPFSLVSRPRGKDRCFAQFAKFLRSGIQLPSSKKLSTDLLDEYHGIVLECVQNDLLNHLYDGYGTLMFDSSEDENLRPIANVLLRVTGGSGANTKTYYLDTVFTGTQKSDSNLYKKIAVDAIEKWIGFKKMSGIFTDNTGNVKRAREDLMKKHGRLVASQDQAHVADKLMQDIGEISWINNVIKTLSHFAVHYRKYRKVKARLEEKLVLYNSNVRRKSAQERAGARADRCESNTQRRRVSTSDEETVQPTTASEITVVHNFPLSSTEGRSFPHETSNSQRAQSEDVSLMNIHEAGYHNLLQKIRKEDCANDEEEEDLGFLKGPSDVARQHAISHPDSLPESDSSGQAPSIFAPEMSSFPKKMKKMSNVRFASAERLLEEYRSVREILVEIVKEDDFDELYSFRTEGERAVRDEQFVKPILDDSLFRNVLQAHGILSACRTYLRVFDKETSLVSEVYEATRILEETLNCLPLANFPEPRNENRDHLLRVFQNRKEGPFPGMKRVRITLLSDLHYAAALLDPFRTSRENLSSHLRCFRNHLDNYYDGENISIAGRSKEELIEEIVRQYMKVRDCWKTRMLMRQDGDSGSGMTDKMKKRSMESPMVVWTDGRIRYPDDKFERKALEELVEFACRTLAISPTATATERTFSLPSRIHTNQRANLAQDKVRKLLFAQWNSRIISASFDRDMFDIEACTESQADSVQALRRMRKAVTTKVTKAFRHGLRQRSNDAASNLHSGALAALMANTAPKHVSRATGQSRVRASSETQEVHGTTASSGRTRNTLGSRATRNQRVINENNADRPQSQDNSIYQNTQQGDTRQRSRLPSKRVIRRATRSAPRKGRVEKYDDATRAPASSLLGSQLDPTRRTTPTYANPHLMTSTEAAMMPATAGFPFHTTSLHPANICPPVVAMGASVENAFFIASPQPPVPQVYTSQSLANAMFVNGFNAG